MFLKRKLYPDAAGIFSFEPKTLDDIKADCRFVLDTNELLLPYKVGSHDLEEIGKVYRKLLGEKRLFLPAQVAREFAANRPDHIKNLAHALVEMKRTFKPTFHRYPLLDGLEEYKALSKQWENAQEQLDACDKLFGQLIERVQGWYWNDPVSKLYHNLFVPEVVVEPEFKQEDVLADHAWRTEHDIPPGYKDTRKPDKGVGDMLIWYTVLHVGKQEPCRSVVFVSGEKKADWVAKSDNKPLFPRYELVDEFRRTTTGQSFHLISPPDLLDLFGADKSTVQRVRTEEALSANIKEAHDALMRGDERALAAAAEGIERTGGPRILPPYDSIREALAGIRPPLLSGFAGLSEALAAAAPIRPPLFSGLAGLGDAIRPPILGSALSEAIAAACPPILSSALSETLAAAAAIRPLILGSTLSETLAAAAAIRPLILDSALSETLAAAEKERQERERERSEERAPQAPPPDKPQE